MSSRILGFIFKNSIKRKLIAIIAALIVFAVLLTTALTYYRYTQDLTAQSRQKTQQILEQVGLNIDTYLDEVFRLCRTPYYNKQLMTLLEQPVFSDQDKLNKQRVIEGFLDEMMLVPRNDILRVYIFADETYSSIKTKTGMDLSGNIESSEWYLTAMNSLNPVLLPLSTNAISFSVAQGLRKISDSTQIIGVIKVDANYAGIKSICDMVSVEDNGALYITDKSGNVLYQNSRLVDNRISSNLIQAALNGSSNQNQLTIGQQQYFINSQTLGMTDWQLIAVNSYDQINRYAIQTRDASIGLAVICAIFAALLSSLLITKLLGPLSKIVDLMKRVQNGDLDVQFQVKSSDEIGFLGSNFNQMVSRIRSMIKTNMKLVKDVYEAKYLQKEAQYLALYNQIRPHFLFNTLNTISILIKMDQKDDAVTGINKLSFLLRGMVDFDKEIPLSEELKIAEAYLTLQKMRFGDGLLYQISIENEYLSYQLPALSLQTLIENAVIHGFKSAKFPTTILVYSKQTESTFELHVQDDGKGIAPDQLNQLQKVLAGDDINVNISVQEETDDSTPENNHHDEMIQTMVKETPQIGVGLSNVNRRIKLKYGPLYGVNLKSENGVGTHVILCLPLSEGR